MENPIYVTKSFLPPKKEYERYLEKIWQTDQLTNSGPLLNEFETKIQEYLNIPNFQFVANGTLALQLAISGLEFGHGDEIITTPFSYVATTSAIMWQNCVPIYVDIDPETLCMDPAKIESAITDKTKAIMPVHVFGNACDVEAIDQIAKKHNLKIIYDAAHAFGSRYDKKSLLSFGDVSIASFHATKLFHTIEGGGIICKDSEVSARIDLQKRFGHHDDNYKILGINAKANEFQAAMGLTNLKYIEGIISDRRKISDLYDSLLRDGVKRQKKVEGLEYNYAYYPVIFESEEICNKVKEALERHNIFPRRYFYPSLNQLQYVGQTSSCPVSESISSRILCLPFYHDIATRKVEQICEIINQEIKK